MDRSYWAKKRILVTGGAGFIGTNVVESLRAAGATEVVVARSRDYDLTRETDVIQLLAEVEPAVVFHLAGYVGGILANKERPADFFYRNLLMGTFLIHHARRHGVERLVAAGAGCGYPQHAPVPLREEAFWDGYPQVESAPYSLAKRMLIVQAEAYYRQHGFVSVVGVPGNVYGPHDNFDLYQAHVIPALVRKFVEAGERGEREVVVWGSGEPARDFVYVGDVVRGLLLAAECYREPRLVNLSSGVATPVRAVVDTLVELTGFGGRVVWDRSKPDGQLLRMFDISRARRELGYEPQVDLRTGLQRTVEWFCARRGELVGGRVGA